MAPSKHGEVYEGVVAGYNIERKVGVKTKIYNTIFFLHPCCFCRNPFCLHHNSGNSLCFCFPPIQSYLRYFQQPSTQTEHRHSFHRLYSYTLSAFYKECSSKAKFSFRGPCCFDYTRENNKNGAKANLCPCAVKETGAMIAWRLNFCTL